MSIRRFLGLFRAILVGVGLVLVAAGIDMVASMPPAPPDSDRFLRGFAYLYSLVLGVGGLLVVQIGYAVPAGIGRFRGGPLADRSAGTRCGVVVVVYLTAALLMVSGFPALSPSVTESTAYVTALLVFLIAAALGVGLTILVAFGGLLIRIYHRQSHSGKRA